MATEIPIACTLSATDSRIRLAEIAALSRDALRHAEQRGLTLGHAAYGAVYITASLIWLWAVEGSRPDRWDLLGASIALVGAAVIVFSPRPS